MTEKGTADAVSNILKKHSLIILNLIGCGAANKLYIEEKQYAECND